MTSAYTKNRTKNSMKNLLFSSDVLYISENKKRTASLLSSIGLTIPIEVQRVGSIGSIAYTRNSVNISGAPFSSIVKETAQVPFSPSLSAIDEEYLAAVNSGDMESARRMVDEAAKAAGYPERGDRGSKKGGGA